MFRPSALLDTRKASRRLEILGSLPLLWKREGGEAIRLGRLRSFSFLPEYLSLCCATRELRLTKFGILHGAFRLSHSSRAFATRGARDTRRAAATGGGMLANEKLVSALCANRSNPDSVKVRVVAKVGNEMTSQVTSLSDAIQLSLQHSKDLIGVALDHDVPVVKVDSIQRIVYEAKKAQSKSKLGSLTEKEVRFRTGIAENDFQRKVDKVVQYLDKGHNCMLSVVANSNNKVPGAARNMATAILERVSNGELTSQLQATGDQRMVQFRLRPTGARRNKDYL